jgi:hypothetical protein
MKNDQFNAVHILWEEFRRVLNKLGTEKDLHCRRHLLLLLELLRREGHGHVTARYPIAPLSRLSRK